MEDAVSKSPSSGLHGQGRFSTKPNYRVELDAVTSIIESPDDPPTAILNRGRPYTITVDDIGLKPSRNPVEYYTVVSICLDNRGSAIEYSLDDKDGEIISPADEFQSRNEIKTKLLKHELKRLTGASFSVRWTVGPESLAKLSIPVCFNFLSTTLKTVGLGQDFYLCVETDVLHVASRLNMELLYCRITVCDHAGDWFRQDVQRIKDARDELAWKLRGDDPHEIDQAYTEIAAKTAALQSPRTITFLRRREEVDDQEALIKAPKVRHLSHSESSLEVIPSAKPRKPLVNRRQFEDQASASEESQNRRPNEKIASALDKFFRR